MGKKRGKSKARHISKKRAKRQKAEKEPVKKQEIPKVSLKDALHDLQILSEEKKVEHKVEEVEKKEEQIERKEVQIAKEEKKLEKETQKVEGLEKKIEKEVSQKPLTYFNFKDLNKGIIGAFIGVVAHFSFIYGSVIAKEITNFRAALLLVFSYLLIVILMYETGYRDIKEKRLLGVLPKRATLIFATSIIVVVIIFFLFNMANLKDLEGFFRQVAVTSVLASLGAGTADLLGKH
ncbi:DUF2391 family protein [Candidatus Woesearchaeota archaeon]|nr:DUF2391 family protein [Candidatus Woesearchaeota archaeon]